MPGFQRRGQSKKLEGARSSRMLRGSPAVKDKGRQERVMEKEEEVRAQQREDGAAFIVAAGEREGGARLDQDGAKPHQTRERKTGRADANRSCSPHTNYNSRLPPFI
uniref:Uncharacterized protein n=1 Tax=Coccidioides posadasii RMSCC 3488 TaxID=454284 RepID=A0A0J6FT55_COCPO|nr:hypothetical protein CPAG_08571 [Coccidioides posadasii RMSCC 3488]